MCFEVIELVMSMQSLMSMMAAVDDVFFRLSPFKLDFSHANKATGFFCLSQFLHWPLTF